MPSEPGDGRYRIVARLGVGGMATVMLAEDTMLGRRVALKRVHTTAGPLGLKRLRREALVGASLNHPNLVSVYDVQLEHDGDLVIVMQYIEGQTLRDAIRSRGALPPGEALRILEGVAAGLGEIHERGIVHRDIKPANILLGSDGTVKLADLGIAAVADRTQITTAGGVVGTFSYMAPEQLEGRSSEAALDIYALAAVAFEMLCGRKARPEPNPLALAHAIATRPPPNLRDEWPQAPAAAAAVLQRGMSSDPAQRPVTARELVRRLGAALEPEPTAQPRKPLAPQRRPEAPAVGGGLRPAAKPGTAPRTGAELEGGVPIKPRSPAAERSSPPQPRLTGPQGARRRDRPRDESGPDRRRDTRIGAVLALLSALVVVGVIVAALDSGGGTSRSHATAGARNSTTHNPRPTRHSSPGSASGPAGPPPGGTVSSSTGSVSSSTGGGGATRSSDAATPSGAVRTFYEDAARHDYTAAWRLADANLRRQLTGLAPFQAQMSAVRSITFHRAQTLGGANASRATVAVQTTSVLADKTQQCAGTVRTLRAPAGVWMLDGISITCKP